MLLDHLLGFASGMREEVGVWMILTHFELFRKYEVELDNIFLNFRR